MTVQARPVTAEELEQMPEEDAPVELARGEIKRMAPAGYYFSRLALRIGAVLEAFAKPRDLGWVFGADAGFILARNPDTVLSPDVSFVTRERIQQQARREGFFEGAPDLAVEVISPSDSYLEVEAKVKEYLDAGTKLVWLVNSRTQIVTAYRSVRDVRRYTADDVLDGDDVLPGFNVPVKGVFE